MEGNFQSIDPTLIEHENNPEEVVDHGDIPQDAELVQLEILKIKEARQKSLENTENLERKLEEEQKAVQEKLTAKTKLQKGILELQYKLNDEKYQSETPRKNISKLQEMLKEIGKFSVRNKHTLQQCSKDKTTTVERNEELTPKSCENPIKLEETCNKAQNEVTLEMKQKVETCNNDFENIRKECEELSQASNNCLNISGTTKDNQQLEEIWHCEEKQSDDLFKQMEKQLRVFEKRKQEICNSLNDAKHTLQKNETEIDGVQKGIKNQTEYNKNFRQKLKAKIEEIADLRLQNNKLEAAQKEKQVQLAGSDQSMTAILNSKLEEEQNAKAMLSEERKILNKTEEHIKDAKQMNEELIRHIQTQENMVAELKIKQNNQLQAITAFEQELSSLQSKLNSLKVELSKWQMKFVKYECITLEEIGNKNDATKNFSVKTEETTTNKEEIETKEEETTTAIIEVIDAIKISFNDDTDDFEAKQKKLELQIQMIEKELTSTRNLQAQLDEELQKLSKDCDKILKKIKDQESLNVPEVDFEQLALPLPPSTGRSSITGSGSIVSNASRTGRASTVRDTSTPGSISTVDYASTASTSTFILSPRGPFLHQAFDELSGSSAPYHRIIEYKREKQRRRQLKEQQRLQSKNYYTSQRKSPGK